MSVLFILVHIVGTSCVASSTDSALIAYVKKEKFNLEIYELSFCLEEVFKVTESDSVQLKVFQKRLQNAFDGKLNEAQRYFHDLELNILQKELSNEKTLKEKYPRSIAAVEAVLAKSKTKQYSYPNFLVPFQNYIEYPEQVDDACIITLLSDLPDDVWKDIKSDELALYRFNTWIEYGFEEFRFYPAIKSSVRKTLNDRIIKYIVDKSKDSSEPLVQQSLKMISVVEKKYERKAKQ